MATGLSRTRSERAGSLLILVAVLLLMGAGIVYLAQPAAAKFPERPVFTVCVPPGTVFRVGALTAVDTPVPWCGQIIVKKAVSPADAPAGSFGFAASFGAFVLAGGEAYDTGMTLVPGVYSVSEVMPLGEGWSLASASCDDGSSPVAIGVSEGETVTCTFNNQHEETTTTTTTAPTTTTTTVPPSTTTTTTDTGGPELPNTGGQPWTLTLLLGGLAAVLMGLSLRVWSLMRQTDKL